MIGYKAFDENLRCQEFQYKVGETYEMDEPPIPCERGFHFCKTLRDVYLYYPMTYATRICRVEATGDIIDGGGGLKYCTNKITIQEEITDICEKTGNTSTTSTGYFNEGVHNTGNFNCGDYNSGNYNIGTENTGVGNRGNFNSGHHNLGINNTGDYNRGNHNAGDRNIGSGNAGNYNVGNNNSGDWNCGCQLGGCFNTMDRPEPTIMMFNKPTNITFSEWRHSDACRILNTSPMKGTVWVHSTNMTTEEKQLYTTHERMGGYLRGTLDNETHRDMQRWWNRLHDNDKVAIMTLPNFDKEIFKECTGIDIDEDPYIDTAIDLKDTGTLRDPKSDFMIHARRLFLRVSDSSSENTDDTEGGV